MGFQERYLSLIEPIVKLEKFNLQDFRLKDDKEDLILRSGPQAAPVQSQGHKIKVQYDWKPS